MARRAQMADGTVLEFPDNTPDDVIDRVAKQHATSKPAQGPWWGEGRRDPALAARNQSRRLVNNAAASVAEGLGQMADIPMQAGVAVQRGVNYALGKGGGAALDAIGLEGAADWWRRGSGINERSLAQTPTLEKSVQTLAPGVQNMDPATRFVGNVLGSMIVPIGPKAARAMPPRLPAARPATQAPPRVPPAIAAASPEAAQVAPLGRRAALRYAQMRRAGVQNPTTAMVTRDPRMWKFEQETAKLVDTGGDMQSALLGVQDDIANAARNLLEKQGGSIGREATGARLGKVLADKNDDLSREVSALYKTVREQSGNARIPSLENLKATYAHPEWADNAQFDDMAAAINKRLGRYADADGGASGLTVSQSEELRKFIGNLGSNDRQGFAMRKVFQNALDADVLDNFGGTPFANARAAAAARFAEFGKTLPGKVAAGDIPAERLGERLLSAQTPLTAVRQLRQSLTTGRTAEQGKEALDTLGAQVLDDLFSKTISAEGKVNGGALAKQFTTLAPRLQIILGPQRYKEVRRLALAAQYATTEVPGAAVNYSNTASMVANMLGPNATKAASNNLLPNFARRAVGAIGGGIVGGPIAGIIGDQAAATVNRGIANKAAQASASKLASQIAIARDPIKAAQIISATATSPKTDPLVRKFAQQLLEQMSAQGTNAARAAIPAVNRANTLLLEQVPLRASAGETPEDQRR